MYDMSRTVVSHDRLCILDALSEVCLPVPGEIAECGVWQGGSAKVISRGGPIHLFDTFTGMPKNDDPCGLVEGSFGNVSKEEVQEYLPNARIYAGLIPETFKGLENLVFRFVHIDVDLYQSTRDCLEYFLPRMSKGGIIVFDDYGFPDYRESERKAVNEMIEVTELPTGQAFYRR